ncbi:MAG: STAS domain-containing protein [Bacteroidales bacterium]
MNAIITTCNNETIVTLSGRLDTTNAEDFGRQIAGLYELTAPQIIFECADFSYISSSGLRIFLTLLKHVGRNKGKMVLRNMRPEIKDVFDMTGLSALFCME